MVSVSVHLPERETISASDPRASHLDPCKRVIILVNT